MRDRVSAKPISGARFPSEPTTFCGFQFPSDRLAFTGWVNAFLEYERRDSPR